MKEKESKTKNEFGSKLTKTLFCYIIPIVLVSAIMIIGIWAGSQRARAEEYKRAAEGMYYQAYTDLVDSIYEINIALSKLTVLQSPSSIAYTLDDIWRSSAICTGLIGQIPQSHVDSLDMNQFILRLGDYARTLSLTCMKGESLSDDDKKQLNELLTAGEKLHEELQYRLSEGIIPDEGLKGESFYSSSIAVDSDGNEIDEFSDEADSKYPTLIYDGPFSESTEQLEPKGLSGENIDESAALMKAYEYLGSEVLELAFESKSEGRIPAFDFHGQMADGRRVDISVSEQGGALVWFRMGVTGNIEGLPNENEEEELIAKCREWLSSHGYGEMEPTYAQYYSGAALINFAAKEGDVIIYNDLIKLDIDRETQTVCGIDARNYLFCHTDRDIATDILPLEEVKSNISDDFKLNETHLALIPATAQTEVLCYEFKGVMGESEFAIYLDARTGEEVKVFRIIGDEHGRLAI